MSWAVFILGCLVMLAGIWLRENPLQFWGLIAVGLILVATGLAYYYRDKEKQ